MRKFWWFGATPPKHTSNRVFAPGCDFAPYAPRSQDIPQAWIAPDHWQLPDLQAYSFLLHLQPSIKALSSFQRKKWGGGSRVNSLLRSRRFPEKEGSNVFDVLFVSKQGTLKLLILIFPKRNVLKQVPAQKRNHTHILNRR